MYWWFGLFMHVFSILFTSCVAGSLLCIFFLSSVSSSHALWPSCKNDWSRLLVSSESHALAVTVGEEWPTNAKPGGHCSWDTPPARSICLLNSDHSLIYAHTVHRDMIQLGTWGRECEYMSLAWCVVGSFHRLPLCWRPPSAPIHIHHNNHYSWHHSCTHYSLRILPPRPATSLSLYEILHVRLFRPCPL